MRITPILFLGLISARMAVCAEFTYVNPNISVSLRDCQIVREGGIYYMTGTFPPFWAGKPGDYRGACITASTDLVHWSQPKVMVPPDAAGWYQLRFWAPEIFPYKNKFYMTFNCPSTGPSNRGPQSVGLAVADAILGPYTVITKDGPLAEGNDATLFLDTDGKVYLYVAEKGIAGIEVNLEKGKAMGGPFSCLPAGGSSDWDSSAPEGPFVGLEGQSVFKRNSIYYLIYSSWRRGYEVGYATAANPHGPWTKYAGNPIYGAQDPEQCKQFHSTFTQSSAVPFGQVGHGSPFFGPDGRLWFCCHGIEQKGRGADDQPHLVITPMEFQPNGSIRMRLTWTPQTVPVPARDKDPMWRDSGTPASEGGLLN